MDGDVKVEVIDIGMDVIVVVDDFDEQEQEAGITMITTINPVVRQ